PDPGYVPGTVPTTCRASSCLRAVENARAGGADARGGRRECQSRPRVQTSRPTKKRRRNRERALARVLQCPAFEIDMGAAMATSDSAARRQEIVRGLGIALLVSLLLSALHLAGAFESFDLRLLDWRFRLRGERPASDAIAIVGVDDATIHAYGSWPVRRDQYALLISALEEARAGAIAVDLQFPDDLNQDPAWNHLLAQVTGNHENVVHAIRFDAEGADPRPLTPDAERIL